MQGFPSGKRLSGTYLHAVCSALTPEATKRARQTAESGRLYQVQPQSGGISVETASSASSRAEAEHERD